MFGDGWFLNAWNVVTGMWLPFAGAALCIAGAVVAWFKLPVFGHYIGAGLIAVSAFLLGDVRGYVSARSDCSEAQLRARILVLESDLSNIKSAADDERRKNQELDAIVLEHQKELANYAEELRRRPARVDCAVTPDDLSAPDGVRR
jgi:hypothetical protein